VQPQVRLILPIFNRHRPVFVNLNSQLFFVPWPTSPKSQTVFSKEILGKSFSAAEVDCFKPIDNEIMRLAKANTRVNWFLFILAPIGWRFGKRALFDRRLNLYYLSLSKSTQAKVIVILQPY
jgi:hypothetical protein